MVGVAGVVENLWLAQRATTGQAIALASTQVEQKQFLPTLFSPPEVRLCNPWHSDLFDGVVWSPIVEGSKHHVVLI